MVVELVDGKRGELTFLVDGRVVAKKGLFFKPSVTKVLQAVRAANNANPDDRAANALRKGVDASRSVIGAKRGSCHHGQIPGPEIPKRVSPTGA